MKYIDMQGDYTVSQLIFLFSVFSFKALTVHFVQNSVVCLDKVLLLPSCFMLLSLPKDLTIRESDTLCLVACRLGITIKAEPLSSTQKVRQCHIYRMTCKHTSQHLALCTRSRIVLNLLLNIFLSLRARWPRLDLMFCLCESLEGTYLISVWHLEDEG